jgi:hypothetical protein
MPGGGIMNMLPNLGLPSPLNNCSFSLTFQGFGAGCLPPQGPMGFLPSPLNGNCSFGASWQGIGAGCMPPPQPNTLSN